MTHSRAQLIAWVDDLASTDPSVRDERALSGLIDAVLGVDAVDEDTARELLDYALRTNGPLAGLGEPEGGDGIFGRSFTLEFVAALSSRENDRPFLGHERKSLVRKSWLDAIDTERDFRSSVDGCGWAHFVAHAADLADEIAFWPLTTYGGADSPLQVIEGLARLISRSPRVYDGEEEDRIANTLASALRQRPELLDAVVDLVHRDAVEHEVGCTRQNWKAVVRSLYFRSDIEDNFWERLRALEAELVKL